MPLPLPVSLTPSKVSSFKECALAFRLSAIDHLPEPPTLPAFKGTVVHRALELLIWEEPPGRRSRRTAMGMLDRALEELLGGEEGLALGLDEAAREDLREETTALVDNYFVLEDPDDVRAIGTELRLEVELGATAGTESAHGGAAPVRLRGIIDRLELGPDGELIVTDYKTGKAPRISQEGHRLDGVHFYAFLCEQIFGRRPVRVQLFHLREPLAIFTTPSDQSVAGLARQAGAIWSTIRRCCALEDFRPKPGPGCSWCSYHAYCPAQGGDLSLVTRRSRAAATGGPTAGCSLPEGATELPTLFDEPGTPELGAADLTGAVGAK
ncbi:MAG TPA: PD-(D/E)XK nuclease family protein [Acidimicrobiales bacterium]|nr:PD-(D/E)XK nuclease family protein [Acidimicrobiales bacterium]